MPPVSEAPKVQASARELTISDAENTPLRIQSDHQYAHVFSWDAHAADWRWLRSLSFGGPLAHGVVGAYRSAHRGDIAVCAVSEDGSTLGLTWLNAPAEVAHFRLPAPLAYVDAIAAAEVPGQGAIIVVSGGENGHTLRLSPQGLSMMGGAPWIKSMIVAQGQLLGFGFETFQMTAQGWQRIASDSPNTPAHVPGLGIVSLGYGEEEDCMVLQQLTFDASYGEWMWQPVTPFVTCPTFGSGGVLGYDARDRSLLYFGGQQGPSAELVNTTYHSRGGDFQRMGGPAIERLWSGSRLLGQDRASKILFAWDDRWNPLAPPIPAAYGPEAPTAATVEEQGIWARDRQGVLWFFQNRWEAKSEPHNRGGSGPAIDAALVWDELGDRLIAHGGNAQNDTWTFTGTGWELLEGERLPKGVTSLIWTPNGPHAGYGPELYRLEGHAWRKLEDLPRSPRMGHFFYDLHHDRFGIFGYEGTMLLIKDTWHEGGRGGDAFEVRAAGGYLFSLEDPESALSQRTLTLGAPVRAASSIPPSFDTIEEDERAHVHSGFDGDFSAASELVDIQRKKPAARIVTKGEGVPSSRIRDQLGLPGNVELCAVIAPDAAHFPTRQALAIVRTESFEERPSPYRFRSLDLFEIQEWVEFSDEMPRPEWRDCPSTRPYGIELIPVHSETGFVQDVERSLQLRDAGHPLPPGELLFPYDVQSFDDVNPLHDDFRDTAPEDEFSHGSKLGGFPRFIHGEVKIESPAGELRPRVQLAEDLFDCAFGDAGRLWLFLSDDGQEWEAVAHG